MNRHGKKFERKYAGYDARHLHLLHERLQGCENYQSVYVALPDSDDPLTMHNRAENEAEIRRKIQELEIR